VRSVSLGELNELPKGEKVRFLGMVRPRERKKPLDGEKVGSLKKVGILWGVKGASR